MMNRLVTNGTKRLLQLSKYQYIEGAFSSETHHHPGLTAKRIIKCVHNKLNQIDPERWNGVPISFNTHWKDEGGFVDIETCVHVHEALEKQFGIDVKDRNILITDIETCFYIITQHHDSI